MNIYEKEVFTIPETAVILRISRGLAYKLAKEGKLPVLKLGNRLLVSRIQLMEYLEKGA